MKTISLSMVGFGNVGKAFARLIIRKKAEIQIGYGLEFRITGIATGHHGMAIDPDGLNLDAVFSLLEQKNPLDSLSKVPRPENILAFIRACPADVLLENTPVNHHTGQPAASHIKEALELGMHAITANKGPVVHAYRELTDLARKQCRKFFFESAVMDGAPIFSLVREALPCVNIKGFHGILNSCTNLLLGLMDQGQSFDQAVAYAQSIGIAETDPSADIDGWDAAIKVAALVTVLMGIPLTPQEVKREGIRALTPASLNEARLQGKRWKLVCSASRNGKIIEASVAPQMVGTDSPLFSINGTSSYVQFETDVLPGLGIVENNPGPDTTAYGLLADLLNALRQD